MRRSIGRAGSGIGVLFLLGASLAVPQILGATSPAAAAAAHVAVAPSPTPGFFPNAGCGTGNPAYNFEGSGDAADPQVVYSAGSYYAFTTGNAPREPHRRAGLVVAQLRLRALHAQLLRIDRAAEPVALGAGEHPDVTGGLRRTAATG